MRRLTYKNSLPTVLELHRPENEIFTLNEQQSVKRAAAARRVLRQRKLSRIYLISFSSGRAQMATNEWLQQMSRGSSSAIWVNGNDQVLV
jgi:hypothetical protein